MLLACYELGFAQVLLQSQVNKITTTEGIQNQGQMAVLSPDSIYLVFKRGTGFSREDNTIIAALSFDGGNSFSEYDVTAPLYEGITADTVITVVNPRVAATATSIVVTYTDLNYPQKNTYIIRSTDGGKTWHKHVYVTTMGGLLENDCISDGKNIYIIGRKSTNEWAISLDDGATFKSVDWVDEIGHRVWNVAVAQGNIWVASNVGITLSIYHSGNNGSTFELAGEKKVDFSGSYDCPPMAAHGDSLYVVYSEEIVGIHTVGWQMYTQNGVVDSGVIYAGQEPPVGERNEAVMEQPVMALVSNTGKEIILTQDNGKTWEGPIKPNLGFYVYKMASFYYLKGIYYFCGNESATIPSVVFWKWKKTNIPYLKVLTDREILAYRDTTDVWLEVVKYTAAKVRLQIASDSGFTDILEEKVTELTIVGVLPDDVGFPGSVPPGIYYARVRSETDSSNSNWSNGIIIDFKKNASIDLKRNADTKKSNFKNSITGNKLVVENPYEKLRKVTLFNIRGRKVAEKTNFTSKRAAFDITSLAPGKYIVLAYGFNSTFSSSILLTP